MKKLNVIALAAALLCAGAAVQPVCAQDLAVLSAEEMKENLRQSCCTKFGEDARRQCLGQARKSADKLEEILGVEMYPLLSGYIDEFKDTDCHYSTGSNDGGDPDDGDDGGRGDAGVQCDVRRSLGDGFGGWLWKGVADVGHMIVVLFPAGQNPNSCHLENPTGKKLFSFVFNGVSNPNRPTYRPAGAGYCQSVPPKSTLKCNFGGKWNCWRIPSPCSRYD